MGKYQSITIKKALENVGTNKYLLPAIQRKFVWSVEQIEMLFDSIMRNYPINTFMLWEINNDSIKNDYKFYQFIKDFVQKFNEDNPDAPNALLSEFYAVIDGQQRLTSLYIGLDGSYRVKRPNKRWKNDDKSMQTKRLYLELSEPLQTPIDNQKYYNFCFLSDDEIAADKAKNPQHAWFKVGDILRFKSLKDVNSYIMKQNLSDNDFAIGALSELLGKINTEELINYCVIDEQDQDKVLEIFLRTNSGGTALTFSDLLMSISSANWKTYDARQEMAETKEAIYRLGNPNFDVSQDFILKSILVLSDSDVKFRIANFGRTNIADFESKWPKIKEALLATFTLLEQLGFNDTLLCAKNAAIPVAYYIYKNDLANSIVKTTYDKGDKKNIARWLSMSLLKGLFGGQSDGILKTIRDVVSASTSRKFPIQEIFDAFKGNPNKNYLFDSSVIDSFLEEQYGSPTAGLVLALLYPDVVLQYGKAVAEDHMHPRTMFVTKGKLDSLHLAPTQEQFYHDEKNFNSVLNLQLLEENINKSKGDTSLENWVASQLVCPKLYVGASTSLKLEDFENFIKDRKKKLAAELTAILKV